MTIIIACMLHVVPCMTIIIACMLHVVHLEEDLPKSKRCVIKIIAPRSQTLADSDYSYLLCTIDLVVEISKPVVVRHPPPTLLTRGMELDYTTIKPSGMELDPTTIKPGGMKLDPTTIKPSAIEY